MKIGNCPGNKAYCQLWTKLVTKDISRNNLTEDMYKTGKNHLKK